MVAACRVMRCCSAQLVRWAADGSGTTRASSSNRQVAAGAAGGKRRRRGAGYSSSTDSSSGGSSTWAPPPAAAAPSSADLAAAALQPLSDRHLLAEKLTQTAKNIVWVDLKHERPAEATREQIEALQAALGYRFKNLYLLRLALIHSSAAPTTHNGIMAWIGDAALYLIVAEEVSAALGYVPIGKLSEVRKVLIGRAMCERYANHLGLGQHLVVGKSIKVQNAGQASSNMLAELFEAVMGAIYLDGDLEAVRRCYTNHFPLPADPLSLLQQQQPAAAAAAADSGDEAGGASSGDGSSVWESG